MVGELDWKIEGDLINVKKLYELSMEVDYMDTPAPKLADVSPDGSTGFFIQKKSIVVINLKSGESSKFLRNSARNILGIAALSPTKGLIYSKLYKKWTLSKFRIRNGEFHFGESISDTWSGESGRVHKLSEQYCAIAVSTDNGYCLNDDDAETVVSIYECDSLKLWKEVTIKLRKMEILVLQDDTLYFLSVNGRTGYVNMKTEEVHHNPYPKEQMWTNMKLYTDTVLPNHSPYLIATQINAEEKIFGYKFVDFSFSKQRFELHPFALKYVEPIYSKIQVAGNNGGALVFAYDRQKPKQDGKGVVEVYRIIQKRSKTSRALRSRLRRSAVGQLKPKDETRQLRPRRDIKYF